MKKILIIGMPVLVDEEAVVKEIDSDIKKDYHILVYYTKDKYEFKVLGKTSLFKMFVLKKLFNKIREVE